MLNRTRALVFRPSVEARDVAGDATLTKLASRHGVHPNQIATWRKQLLQHAGAVLDHGTPALDDPEWQVRGDDGVGEAFDQPVPAPDHRVATAGPWRRKRGWRLGRRRRQTAMLN